MNATSSHPTFDDLARAARLAAVGDAFPGLAHEVNNALLAISGLAELTLGELEPGTKPHERVSLLLETALDLKETIRALHVFARTPDTHGPVALDALVQELVVLVERTSSSHMQRFETVYGDGDLRVTGGARGLGQVVLALLARARQAPPEGGTVAVAVERTGDTIVLTVSAPGLEIGDDEGLDLFVARRVAETHGGALESAPGALTLTLPATEER